MSVAEILLIAFGVSVDAAAISVSGSLCPGKYSKRRCVFNAAVFFGGFQFIMPLIGFYTAGIFTDIFAQINHYAAFFLLSFVGGKMIYEALKKKSDNQNCPLGEFFSAKNLILPATATSLDALAIGAGLAFSGAKIWLPALAMGVITAAVSAICIILGKQLKKSSVKEEKLTVAAGIIIILIGIKIFMQAEKIIPIF